MQLNERMRSGFERMTSCVTNVISLDFCTKSFENVHLICENSTKANEKKTVLLIIKDKLLCIVNVSILSFLNHSFYKNDLKTEICEVYLFIKTFLSKLYLNLYMLVDNML